MERVVARAGMVAIAAAAMLAVACLVATAVVMAAAAMVEVVKVEVVRAAVATVAGLMAEATMAVAMVGEARVVVVMEAVGWAVGEMEEVAVTVPADMDVAPAQLVVWVAGGTAPCLARMAACAGQLGTAVMRAARVEKVAGTRLAARRSDRSLDHDRT